MHELHVALRLGFPAGACFITRDGLKAPLIYALTKCASDFRACLVHHTAWVCLRAWTVPQYSMASYVLHVRWYLSSAMHMVALLRQSLYM